MTMHVPVRLGPAELKLIDQLTAAGAVAEAERLSGAGLPTRRVEAYHYTDLKQLLRTVPELAAAATEASVPALRVAGAYQLMIANGVVQETGTAPAGVIVGKAAGGVLSTRDDVVTRLNMALTKECLTLDLDGSVDPVIQIDRRTEGAAGHSTSAAKIFVADDSSAVIVETYAGSEQAHLGNHATYLALGKNAKVTHITVNLAAAKATHFASNEYHLAEGAQLRTLIINAGAALSRTQLFPRYEGAGAHADITGLNLVSEGQHADITMDALHAVPHTSSKPLFKSIARGRSKAVVQGRLVVARDAQKTDAKLMSQGLMLSDEAEILCKPELEIYADDVVCGHGSTCGQLDEDSLFYLTSRGIAKADAETMLVRAFLAELVDPIEDEALNEALTAVIEGWLAGK
ncbi:Fe-S cluster assembly protein SufD [Devosia insulae DS-56]|uniref:Fe-S cluster assembly protein SufD n=2 Tax=Devosia insulae TaxID=408174 RepID=A0A1E5XV54_9HYPH|nr:Fe-S cluster assembly protein SufD [Devosia insulae DS-56]